MNVLALDLGTRTGWALVEHGRVEHGAMSFAVNRHESPGYRYIKFNRWLEDFTLDLSRSDRSDMRRVGLIVYEAAHARGGPATEIAAGFVTRVQEFCARTGLEYKAVHTATLKKFATGKGNADKAAMVEAVTRRWGRVESDDEADALALLHYALADLVPAVPPAGA